MDDNDGVDKQHLLTTCLVELTAAGVGDEDEGAVLATNVAERRVFWPWVLDIVSAISSIS